jgi:hypothetical protein
METSDSKLRDMMKRGSSTSNGAGTSKTPAVSSVDHIEFFASAVEARPELILQVVMVHQVITLQASRCIMSPWYMIFPGSIILIDKKTLCMLAIALKYCVLLFMKNLSMVEAYKWITPKGLMLSALDTTRIGNEGGIAFL